MPEIARLQLANSELGRHLADEIAKNVLLDESVTRLTAQLAEAKRILDGKDPIVGVVSRNYLRECEANAPALVKAIGEGAALRAKLETAREALEAWKIRLAFVGHPNEPKDWSAPVQFTDKILSATETR